MDVFIIEVRSSGFQCSMDGFVGLVSELMHAIFFLVTMLMQLVLNILPNKFGAASCYSYMYLINLPVFLGYFLAGFYYFAEHFGTGTIVCASFGYIYWVLNQLFWLIDWVMEIVPGAMTNPNNDTEDICDAFLAE